MLTVTEMRKLWTTYTNAIHTYRNHLVTVKTEDVGKLLLLSETAIVPTVVSIVCRLWSTESSSTHRPYSDIS